MTTRMRRIATFAAAALLMASCQRMELDQIPSTENDLIEFTFSKPVTSRAQINPNGSGSFEEGDCVGLYVGTNPARYYRLTLQNGVWTPGIPRHELGKGTVTINACYPAPSETETEVTTFSHSISADQSAEGYAASDLLWCHRTFDPDALSDKHVVMTFAHAMHRLEITITNESGALPTDLQVAVRTATEVTMDFESGQPKIGESTLEWITPATDPSQAGRYLTVVAPPIACLATERTRVDTPYLGREHSI